MPRHTGKKDESTLEDRMILRGPEVMDLSAAITAALNEHVPGYSFEVENAKLKEFLDSHKYPSEFRFTVKAIKGVTA